MYSVVTRCVARLQSVDTTRYSINGFTCAKDNIVVTERSRREMAEQEEEKNKKRIPPKQ